VLIGYSSGATIMYAALAQAGDARFGGAMTLGFCPDLIIHKPFCEGAGLTADKQTKPPYGIVFNTVPAVKAPWIVLQGDIDQVCNPPATEAFVKQVQGGRVVMLPKVGHGYSVPSHWMPQYRQGLLDLLDTAQPSRVADVRD
jgi:type IV secretory pathway VirJ component